MLSVFHQNLYSKWSKKITSKSSNLVIFQGACQHSMHRHLPWLKKFTLRLNWCVIILSDMHDLTVYSRSVAVILFLPQQVHVITGLPVANPVLNHCSCLLRREKCNCVTPLQYKKWKLRIPL